VLPDQSNIIAKLKKEILLLSGIKAPLEESIEEGGLSFMQSHFPCGVFPKAAVHEFICHEPQEIAVTGGFIAALVASFYETAGTIIWISPAKNIFPATLQLFNIDPSRMIFIHPKGAKECLWVMEEALKCRGLHVVIAEMNELSFVHSRRFQLAVENSKVTGFIMNMKPGREDTTACVSKWKIKSLPSETSDELPGVGHPRWNVALTKMRNGKTGNWELEWVNGKLKQVPQENLDWLDETLHQQTG
jgi:protein ImuA